MSLNQVIVSKRISDPKDPLLDLVEQTYNDSFPVEERRDFYLLRGFIVTNPLFELHVFLQDDQFVGFITAWQLDGFIYVEHFAINASFRNGGIGAKSMTSFLSSHSLPVVLEVELPADDLSKRRIGFYQRLGFQLDNHVYYQPQYHPEDEILELRLMTHGSIVLDDDRFAHVQSEIFVKAYGSSK